MSTLKPNEFVDSFGVIWSLKVGVRALRLASEETGLAVEDLQGEQIRHIGFDKLASLLWFSVQKKAERLGVTREVFEEERLPLNIFFEKAIPALVEALAESFPKPEDLPAKATEGEESGPFEKAGRGDGKT